MKLKHFLQPLDSSFSTPKAARKLLHLFAAALVLGLFAGAGSYLRTAFNDEVSLRRSDMNAAISDAQNFFVSRQTLLRSLGLSAVRNVVQPKPNLNEVPTEEVHIALGQGADSWSLWLTKRMLAHLRQSKVNLLYIGAGQGLAPDQTSTITRLFSIADSVSPVPMCVPRRLRAFEGVGQPTNDYLWLSDQSDAASPLYIFTRLDERSPASGWLGLEVEVPDLMEALRHDSAGDFLLLDARGEVIFTSAVGQSAYQALDLLRSSNAFGLVGGGWFPQHLAIKKQLGYSQWQIVYTLKLSALLPALAARVLTCLLSCLIATILMCWLVRRIDRRLIIPAGHRIEALVESEAFSSTVIRIAPVALCVLRRSDGKVVLQNPLAEQWLGHGQEREQLCHGWIHRAFDQLDRNGSDEIELADGRHLYLAFAPTRYQREEVLICAFSDISARKQVERALQQARRSADAANEAKTLFLATMSHEIRTPLYGVLGTLELLTRTELNGQQRNYLKAIEGSSANLLQLICDVLDVAKIEAGQLSLELTTFSPLALVREVMQGYAGAAQGKGLRLFSCIDPQMPQQLRGDVTRLRQVLNNLLSNALKFTDSGRIVLRVRVDTRDEERPVLHWQIVDTGKGISREDQQHLFEPFFQASGNANVVAGTGLGLSICKRLIHLMNGNLRVVSEPGLGSSFAFDVPLEQVREQPGLVNAEPLMAHRVYVVSRMHDLSDSVCGWLRRWGAIAQVGVPAAGEVPVDAVLVELETVAEESSLVPHWLGPRVIASPMELTFDAALSGIWQANLNNLEEIREAVSRAQGQARKHCTGVTEAPAEMELNLRVLVVEDNVINQLILRDQLEELGCNVVLAGDGVEALSLWHAAEFDLVLTDVNMPRMNGYELAAQLRQRDCTLPIIGATANAMREEGDKCLAAGMNQCLIKPVTLRALHQCLQHYPRRVA